MKIGRLLVASSVLALTITGATTTGAATTADAHPATRGTHLHVVAAASGVPGENFFASVTSTTGTLTYGTARLTALATVDGSPLTVEITAGLEYINGSGPFHGAVDFIDAQGDQIAFDYAGRADQKPDGSTTVTGSLTALSATGAFANSTGTGTVVGTRAAGSPVGSPITYVMDVDLHGGVRPMPHSTSRLPEVEHPNASLSVGLMGLPAERIVTANPDGRAFGIIRLTGPSTFQGVPVTVIDQASIAYSNGSGPFNGFITLLAADSSRVVMRFNGSTAATPDGGATVSGELTVIAATGQWTGLHGKGIMTGTRSGVVGSPLMAQAILSLHR
jgi:hypothetical protein